MFCPLNYRVYPLVVAEHESSNAGVEAMLAVRGIDGLHQLGVNEPLKRIDEFGFGLPSVGADDLTHPLDADEGGLGLAILFSHGGREGRCYILCAEKCQEALLSRRFLCWLMQD